MLTAVLIVVVVDILLNLYGVWKSMAKIDDLKAAVAAETTVDQSVITLLNGLTAQIAALKGTTVTDADLQSVIDSVNANAAALSAAVTANTPATS